MPTGLLVRDFVKEYREERYANSGAIRLTETEHNAYVTRLTVEITHFDAYRAINFKTLPENTHWGYLTGFKGSSVAFNQPIKFTKQRVYDGLNQGIWNYHQDTESLRVQDESIAQATTDILRAIDDSGDSPWILSSIELAAGYITNEIGQALDWVIDKVRGTGTRPTTSENFYRAFPIASPFPDVFKFKSDIPVSFLFRLESWYLVNPAVYITDNPTDTGDATEGEDEYPSPEAGDGDGQGEEFPPSSPLDPRNDPRDGGENPSPEVLPGTTYLIRLQVRGTLLSGSAQPEPFVDDGIEVVSLGNGLPFTVEAGPGTIVVYQGESWGQGFTIYDRFGDSLGNFYSNVGFRFGSMSIVGFTVEEVS